MPDSDPPSSLPSTETKQSSKLMGLLHALKRIGFIIAIGVSLLWITACQLQEKMIFPSHVAPEALPVKPLGCDVWERDLEAGEKVEAYWFEPAGGVEAAAGAVLFFHGNAEIADHQMRVWQRYLAMGYAVLIMEYRSYGASGGKPTQKAIVSDAVYFYERVLDAGVKAEKVILHGRSLGGGVAAQLAQTHPPKAMILESTFSSVVAMAGRRMLPGFLVMHPFRTDRVVKKSTFPILHLHGADDTLIPVEEAQKLKRIAEKAGRPYNLQTLPGGHNNFPLPRDEDRFWQLIGDFLKARE